MIEPRQKIGDFCTHIVEYYKPSHKCLCYFPNHQAYCLPYLCGIDIESQLLVGDTYLM